MKKILTIMLLIAAFATGLTAQVLKPVKWQITQKKVSEGVYDIVCKATIENTWHLYDTKLPEGGPLPTTFNMDEDETSGIQLIGIFKATTAPKVEHSEAFDMDLKYFVTTVTFTQRVKVTSAKAKLVGYVEFMACCGGQCIPPAEAEFSFDLTK
ncbi:MAG: protein-disulfide reductase DsbD family protein [Odoribacter sp.]